MDVNPFCLLDELKGLKEKGIEDYNLIISKRVTLLLPYHIELDKARENALGDAKIGTTKNGIGPAYEDKAARLSIRAGDLLEPEYLLKRLNIVVPLKNLELKAYGGTQFTVEEIYNDLMKAAEVLKSHITDTTVFLQKALKENKKVLFEGAQGAMLCLNYGTFPYVTSSSPLATAIPGNTGLPLDCVDTVLGIMKAYTTRVGEGPFPSEFDDEVAHAIREKGHEYGTVTHRPRRVGWLDIPQLKYVASISGIKHVALMLLDVLSATKEIKIVTKYFIDGKEIDYMPSTVTELARVTTESITLPSWSEDISDIKKYEDLPENCRKYIETIEKLMDVSIDIISVSPEADATIIKRNLL